MGKPRPPEVVRAIIDEDSEALKAMGKKGGKISGKLSARRADDRAAAEVFRAEHEARNLADAKKHEEELFNGVPEHDR